MKLQLLEDDKFRGKSFKKGDIVDFPLGLANQMLLHGRAQKASPNQEVTKDEVVNYKTLNKDPLIEYAENIGIDVPNEATKEDIYILIEEMQESSK